jgi:hypothetical protein
VIEDVDRQLSTSQASLFLSSFRLISSAIQPFEDFHFKSLNMVKLDKIPLAGTPLQATIAFYIQGGTLLRSFAITDITSSTPITTFLATPLNDLGDLLADAKGDAAAQAALIQLDKPSPFSTSLTAQAASGETIATISGSKLSLGRCTITFAAKVSPHASHPVKVRPARIGSQADEFLLDGVPFFWGLLEGTRRLELSKVVDGKRCEVGRFVSVNTSEKEGVLLVDGNEVDRIVAALTCVTVLNRVDSSFRF